MDTWNPTQYDKFRREREQPFFNLLALLHPVTSPRVVDLGCGTGALTAQLHARLQARDTIGIDRSPRMLDNAVGDRPAGLRFEVGTIEAFDARDAYDVIVSNAAFHWVDDHASLIPRLFAALAPGGQLAFQVSAMHDDLSHTVAKELTSTAPFKEAFAGWQRPQPVLPPEGYARLLHRSGFAAQHVRLAVYPHVLAGPEAVVEWMKGTLLTDNERHLPPDLFPRFVDAYRARLLEQLDHARPFFFPFNRILCWGTR